MSDEIKSIRIPDEYKGKKVIAASYVFITAGDTVDEVEKKAIDTINNSNKGKSYDKKNGNSFYIFEVEGVDSNLLQVKRKCSCPLDVKG